MLILQEFVDKIEEMFEIISNEKKELGETLKEGMQKFKGDKTLFNLCKKYKKMFNVLDFGLNESDDGDTSDDGQTDDDDSDDGSEDGSDDGNNDNKGGDNGRDDEKDNDGKEDKDGKEETESGSESESKTEESEGPLEKLKHIEEGSETKSKKQEQMEKNIQQNEEKKEEDESETEDESENKSEKEKENPVEKEKEKQIEVEKEKEKELEKEKETTVEKEKKNEGSAEKLGSPFLSFEPLDEEILDQIYEHAEKASQSKLKKTKSTARKSVTPPEKMMTTRSKMKSISPPSFDLGISPVSSKPAAQIDTTEEKTPQVEKRAADETETTIEPKKMERRAKRLVDEEETKEQEPPAKRIKKPSRYLVSPYNNRKTALKAAQTPDEFMVSEALFSMQGDP